MIREDTDVEIKNKQIDSGCIAFTISLFICIGIGILCIWIAFQHNESDDGKSLKLTGNIVLVMYLGIGIIGCILIYIIGRCFLNFAVVVVNSMLLDWLLSSNNKKYLNIFYC